jgi:hypothetical protein
MSALHMQPVLEEAFGRVEESILPSLSAMLDSLLDAASLARPGMDAETYAENLRAVALKLQDVTLDVEALSATPAPDYRAASAA